MKSCKHLVDVGRRSFLRGGAVVTAGATAAAIMPARLANATPRARVDYPSNRLANVADLKTNEPVDIAYPDADSPGVLIKLGTRVDGGVGTDGDIVAFSTLCPHKGYVLTYDGRDRTLNCPGHYSRFDCEKEGQQIWGHANQNLPMFLLRVDDEGDVYAEGVDDLIYGRFSNVLSA